MSIHSLDNERELLIKIANGDEAAFTVLFNRYVPKVSEIAFQVVKTEAGAKDVVQNTFMQLWLGRDRLVEVEAPELWIYRLTYNCAYQFLKKKLLQEQKIAKYGAEHAAEIQHYETEETLNARETQRLIFKAIQNLPLQSKKIYELNRISGMSPQAIAEELDINVQSVRNSLTRSTKFIKDHLAENGVIIPSVFLLADFFFRS